jgi:hypothetical protein
MLSLNIGNMMTKTAQITIRELDPVETIKLIEDDTYNCLFPVRCSSCRITNGFNRRIFHITGVLKRKQSDETTQNMLQYHFLNFHKIKWVFFRTHSKKFYADSANCLSCKSTAVTFDISYEYAMSEYAKAAGKNIIPFKIED